MIDEQTRRSIIKIALSLQDYYRHVPNECGSPTIPWAAIDELERLNRMYDKSCRRRWFSAARQVRRMIRLALETLQRQLVETAVAVSAMQELRRVPSLRLLYDEVASLFDEFPTVELSVQKGEIAVETDWITLDGVDLGPFAICLKIDRLSRDQPYTVRALDAHEAMRNSSVTHPHVQQEQLCEGEGRFAIRSALDAGRIGEFFILVRQILQTYNASSAYVQLDQWHGVSCVGCADFVSEDDAHSCEDCESSLCSDCYSYCSKCDVQLCYECATDCSDCGQRCCGECIHGCVDCHESFCGDCLEEDRCSTCRSKQQESEDESQPAPLASPPEITTPTITTTSQTITAPTNAQVQPDCLGQAAVPA